MLPNWDISTASKTIQNLFDYFLGTNLTMRHARKIDSFIIDRMSQVQGPRHF
jgi:hypothetical protein